MARKQNSEISKKLRNSEMELEGTFAERLRFCTEVAGSISALAKLSGLNPSSFTDYLANRSDPSRDKLVRIAKAAKVSVSWLATGEGEPYEIARPMTRSEFENIQYLKGIDAPTLQEIQQEIVGIEANSATAPVVSPGTTLQIDVARLPVMNVVASAGDGAAVLKEEIAEYMSLSRSLVRSLGLSLGDTFIIYGRGESMEPVVRGGEPLICSSAERHLKAGDGIYVIRLEGDILVKHVQRMPGGKLRISSENKNYAPFEVTLNDGTDFAILGKVLHALRQV